MTQRHENTQVRRRQIISAARKLIVKYGSEHVTVRKMAKEIGVTEAAIYRHFKSKSDILSFLVDDIEKTLMTDIQNNVNKNKDANALEILESILKDHISSIEQRKGISFQVIAEIISLGDKKLNQKIYEVITRYIEHIRELLSQGADAGVIREDVDVAAAAALFFGMMQGVVNLWALSHYSFDLQQKFLPLWKVFREAIKPGSIRLLS